MANFSSWCYRKLKTTQKKFKLNINLNILCQIFLKPKILSKEKNGNKMGLKKTLSQRSESQIL